MLASAIAGWTSFVRIVQHERQVELERVSAIRIQSRLRGRAEHNSFQRTRAAFVRMQSVQRGRVWRKELATLNKAASKIQSNFRGTKMRRLMKVRKPGRGELRPATPPSIGGADVGPVELSAVESLARGLQQADEERLPRYRCVSTQPGGQPLRKFLALD